MRKSRFTETQMTLPPSSIQPERHSGVQFCPDGRAVQRGLALNGRYPSSSRINRSSLVRPRPSAPAVEPSSLICLWSNRCRQAFRSSRLQAQDLNIAARQCLVPFLCFPVLEEAGRGRQTSNGFLNFIQRDPKELLSKVRHNDSALSKFLMQGKLQGGR